ncbi:MAG: peptidoglycan-binding protein [Hyphomicrobiaceae bacterium]
MIDIVVRFLVAAAFAGFFVEASVAQESLQRHTAITGDRRPTLCADRDTVSLVVAVVERAALERSHNNTEKAKNLYEIAARLQAEVCAKPGADDAVFVRCDLGHRNVPGSSITLLKVTAVIRSEIAKGEQTFYSWSYRPVEALATAAADAADLDRRWCDDVREDKPIAATPDRILQVQARFYDLGVSIGPVNGQLTPETIRAITNFQTWAKLPATGELSEQTLAKLNALDAPSPWVAVAFDGSGNYGFSRGGPTRRGSEQEAIQRLRQRSQSDYKISSSAAPNCIGFATTRYRGRSQGRRVNYTQAFTSIAPTRSAAGANVIRFCNQQKGGGTCQLREMVCAAETREDSISPSVNAAPPSREDSKAPSINSRAPTRFDPQQPLTANSPAPIAQPD